MQKLKFPGEAKCLLTAETLRESCHSYMEEMGHTPSWTMLNVKSALRTLFGIGQGHSMGVRGLNPRQSQQQSHATKLHSHRMLWAHFEEKDHKMN